MHLWCRILSLHGRMRISEFACSASMQAVNLLPAKFINSINENTWFKHPLSGIMDFPRGKVCQKVMFSRYVGSWNIRVAMNAELPYPFCCLITRERFVPFCLFTYVTAVVLQEKILTCCLLRSFRKIFRAYLITNAVRCLTTSQLC